MKTPCAHPLAPCTKQIPGCHNLKEKHQNSCRSCILYEYYVVTPLEIYDFRYRDSNYALAHSPLRHVPSVASALFLHTHSFDIAASSQPNLFSAKAFFHSQYLDNLHVRSEGKCCFSILYVGCVGVIFT